MNQYFTIGRSPENNMVIVSNYISTHHARLSRMNGVLFVEDLGSRNGTFVDDAQITRQRIIPGQEVQLSRRYTLDWNHPVLSAWIHGKDIIAQTPPQPSYAAPIGGTPVQLTKNNGLAIASMICGIIGIIVLGLVLGTAGVIMGIFALNTIRRNQEALAGKGMAITGIVTGSVGILGHILWIILLS